MNSVEEKVERIAKRNHIAMQLLAMKQTFSPVSSIGVFTEKGNKSYYTFSELADDGIIPKRFAILDRFYPPKETLPSWEFLESYIRENYRFTCDDLIGSRTTANYATCYGMWEHKNRQNRKGLQ